jgi:glycosyltransferase involved in cell wall biosynthesis
LSKLTTQIHKPEHRKNQKNQANALSIARAASGTPIVASGIPSFRGILSDGKYGLLFKSGDDEALSNAILKLASDSANRRELSHVALESVKKHNSESIAARVALYCRAIDRSL